MLVLYLIGKYLSILMSANMHWNYLRVFVIMQTSGRFFSPHGGWIIDASFPLRHWCYKHNRTSVSARHFFLNKRNTALFFKVFSTKFSFTSFLSLFNHTSKNLTMAERLFYRLFHKALLLNQRFFLIKIPVSYTESLSAATYLFIFQLVLTLIQEIRKIP